MNVYVCVGATGKGRGVKLLLQRIHGDTKIASALMQVAYISRCCTNRESSQIFLAKTA